MSNPIFFNTSIAWEILNDNSTVELAQHLYNGMRKYAGHHMWFTPDTLKYYIQEEFQIIGRLTHVLNIAKQSVNGEADLGFIMTGDHAGGQIMHEVETKKDLYKKLLTVNWKMEYKNEHNTYAAQAYHALSNFSFMPPIDVWGEMQEKNIGDLPHTATFHKLPDHMKGIAAAHESKAAKEDLVANMQGMKKNAATGLLKHLLGTPKEHKPFLSEEAKASLSQYLSKSQHTKHKMMHLDVAPEPSKGVMANYGGYIMPNKMSHDQIEEIKASMMGWHSGGMINPVKGLSAIEPDILPDHVEYNAGIPQEPPSMEEILNRMKKGKQSGL